ncbi:hypothetical protein HCY48_05295 [Limosilactobacillus fermentum]
MAVGKMTMSEFYLRLEAYQLKRLNDQQDLATMAWLNQAVQATKGSAKNPKPKFSRFTQFFDWEKEERKIRREFGDDYSLGSKTDQEKAPQTFAERLAEYKRLRAKGLIDLNAWRKEDK